MRPALRTASWPAAGGTGAGVLCWLFGVYPPDAVLIGLLVAAAFAVPAFVHPVEPVAWPQPVEEARQGGCYDVRRFASLLDMSAREHDMITTRLAPRLRELAASRLEHRGVRWADPEARRLLGSEVYDVLDDPAAGTAQRPPSPVALTERVLDRLDTLPDEDEKERTP